MSSLPFRGSDDREQRHQTPNIKYQIPDRFQPVATQTKPADAGFISYKLLIASLHEAIVEA
ncbi:hypothetical protein QUA04_13485 [Microcoleus sp. S13_C5]